MSPNMKLTMLALVGAAAAIPQYNAHSKFHHKSSGYAGPTSGWSNVNATGVAAPSGTGALPSGTGVSGKDTTTLDSTSTSTTTLFKTIYATKPSSGGAAPSSVEVAGLSSGAAECGPATVYITATNKVTVTVPAGGAASSVYPPPAGGASYSAVAPPAGGPSSSVVEEAPVPSSAAVVSSVEAATSSVYVAPPVASSTKVTPPVSSAEVPPPVASSTKVTPPVASSTKVTPPVASSVEVAPPVSSAEVAPSSSAVEATPVSSAAPSSTPSSTPGGGYTGGKRGLVYRYDGAAGAKTFENSNMGFCWNWEADTKGDIGGLAANFIPTLRTLANAGEWAEKVEAAIAAGSKVVFGFNEPDMPDQASLDVATACKAWKDNMNFISEDHPDVIVVGPSVSSSDKPGQGLSWLQSFKDDCKEAVWHQANIHWYGPPEAGFDAFKSHVETAISKFGKVWVSEFALYQGSSVADSKAFLEKAQKYLDGNDDCVGYSYFAAGSFDPNYNLLGTADAPTELGSVYLG